MQKFFIFDAHGYMHRAYHALPPLTTSQGQPVGALYGFARMLLKVLKEHQPDYLAVCFDTPEPTHRHKQFPEYKATRKKADAELVSQLPLAEELVGVLGLPSLRKPGYEADDLMATLAEKAAAENMEVVLVTEDKDILQLLGPQTHALNSKGDFIELEDVKEKYGLSPGQLVDFFALMGDSVDNVPGVRGIGKVGAAKLIRSYGSLDSLLKAVSEKPSDFPKAVAENLAQGQQQALLSRALVTLERNVPFEFRLGDFKRKSVEVETAVPFLQRLEFTSLAKEYFNSANSHAEAPDPIPFNKFLEKAKVEKRVSVAVVPPSVAESLLREDAGLLCVLGLPSGSVSQVKISEESTTERQGLLLLLADETIFKTGQDFKTILLRLLDLGLEIKGTLFDTMLAAYCVNPSRSKYDFGELALEYLGRPVPRVEAQAMALFESLWLFELAAALQGQMAQKGVEALFWQMEMPVMRILTEMQRAGIQVDRAYLERLSVEFSDRIEGLRRELEAMAGGAVNLNSPKQIGQLLFEKFGLPALRKTKTGYSTDEDTLSALSAGHPFPGKLLQYRELMKLRSTYVEGLLKEISPETGRVHTHFNQTGTATGRLSSAHPNLQNIPIRTELGLKVRRAFVPGQGKMFLALDYSQVDLRSLAHVSEDKALCEVFSRGGDVHAQTACDLFQVSPKEVTPEMRRKAKAVNFGVVYGQTPYGLSQELGIPVKEAEAYIKQYFEKYAGVAAWTAKSLEEARQKGLVRTISGRLRYLPELNSKNAAVRGFAERAALNTPIQGSSADIIKQAMIRIGGGLKTEKRFAGVAMLLQIHDDLLFEVPEENVAALADWARLQMEQAVRLKVPVAVTAKAGPNWQDMRPLENI
ncbi:MAG: DNA polymerase I [Elusimicrobia bacterium]|nr:DNA polymerase I [Elusimicrobiota bacterium]